MIDKAHRYAEEPRRVQLARLEAVVRGDNSDHTVTLADGRLSCDCDHYEHERLCAHVLIFVTRASGRNLVASSIIFSSSNKWLRWNTSALCSSASMMK